MEIIQPKNGFHWNTLTVSDQTRTSMPFLLVTTMVKDKFSGKLIHGMGTMQFMPYCTVRYNITIKKLKNMFSNI